MRILNASDTYAHQTNGVATSLDTLVDGLRRLGHEVKVLAPANGRESARRGDDYLIRSLPAPYYPGERLCLARRDPLVDELKGWKPDVVHLHTEGPIGRMAIGIAERSRAPVVITSHTDFAKFAFGRLSGLLPVRATFTVIGRLFYPHAQAIVVPSHKSLGFAWLQPYADRITVIPNGVRLARFQRPVTRQQTAELRERLGLARTGPTLVMVTRVSREKNVIEILRYLPSLLEAVPGAQLVVVGDGPDRGRLERYCTRRGLSGHVRFVGGVSPEDVYRYYALGDVFACASSFEVLSMTYIEAMACGLPMVCRRDASLTGVLEDGQNGFTYESQREFVSSASRILADRRLREAMGAHALQRAAEYRDDVFAGRMVALYEGLQKDQYKSPRTQGVETAKWRVKWSQNVESSIRKMESNIVAKRRVY